MKRFKLNVVLPVLTLAIATACSNSEDLSSASPPAHKGVSQDLKDKAEPITQSPETDAEKKADVEKKVEAETTISRSAESHTHGDAQLAIVLENGDVTIELDSPLYNILGFEHAPETEAQKVALSRAENQLGRASELFTFSNGAGCKAASEDQKVTLFDSHDPDEHHHDKHSDIAQHDHDDHGDDHDDSSHRDVLLSYNFRCQNLSSLSNIRVNLFEFFSELSEVNVTYLGPSVQKQVILTPQNSKVEITQ